MTFFISEKYSCNFKISHFFSRLLAHLASLFRQEGRPQDFNLLGRVQGVLLAHPSAQLVVVLNGHVGCVLEKWDGGVDAARPYVIGRPLADEFNG